ncbi:hypothetical protein RSOLAG1IB_07419 [Rhizoctonia solani AG-1 IB]|uniref:Zn(2)-C6 fungal-type domain-containing protein n=1 Tax=Thanatephorus cucumeris (strain AG1-IB / isolate 7/3/14) TaxID=1108050 RepID=A0A0B7FFE2_THACB|nr:hypothetical protein RSOLAG1IB_07419 [Rhizoctonia solani AG-1 IB]
MSSASQPRHGPRPTSCLTCWQRRKKCDLTQPCCETCLKSGIECLGYGPRPPQERTYRRDSRVLTHRSEPNPPVVPSQQVPSQLHSNTFTTSANSQHNNNTDTTCDSTSSLLGIGLRYMATDYAHTSHGAVLSREDFDHTWLQNQNRFVRDRPPSQKSSNAKKSIGAVSAARSTRNHMAGLLGSLCASIPPSVVSAHTIGEARFIHMINEYQLQRVNCWFMPPPPHVRGAMIDQLKSSRMMISTVFLGLKLLKTLDQGSYDSVISGHSGWINKLEQQIIITSKKPSLRDTAERLMAQLELTFIGFVTVSVALGYSLLRKALPGFLRLVASDPNLMTEHPNGNLFVSFPRTLEIPQQGLNTFILYDAATAFALGVPALVEYGHDGECAPTSHGYQCVHGVPVPLVEIISQINSWRTGSRTTLQDWQTLETRAITWQAQPLQIEDENAGVNIARLAVQESWRYVTLVYLYMGMCGLSSHDLRVRTSIARIVELEQSVTDISISMHMLMHYVVLGLGARHEQQRSIIRERLLSFQGRRVWLFRGPEFSRVLDHLWSGVGAGGAPVTWDDYVESRCTVLPI